MNGYNYLGFPQYFPPLFAMDPAPPWFAQLDYLNLMRQQMQAMAALPAQAMQLQNMQPQAMMSPAATRAAIAPGFSSDPSPEWQDQLGIFDKDQIAQLRVKQIEQKILELQNNIKNLELMSELLQKQMHKK